MVKRHAKFESGEATSLVSRKQALKKLQLTLNDFRRLCILKGIYPQEPRNKKRAGKGSTQPKVFYHLKDVQFLAHEPVMQKLRDLKAHLKKVHKAKERGDAERIQRLQENKPSFSYDHIVRERYPTFEDAVRDLDDCLTLSFLFALLPKERGLPVELLTLCGRLTVQFLLWVCEARALRKAFISIKGFFLQAEVCGEPVTWCLPHSLGLHDPADVDFRVLQTFAEFYSTLLGFANFRLYQQLGLAYPPTLQTSTASSSVSDDLCLRAESHQELLGVLNQPLKRRKDVEVDVEVDEFSERPLAERQRTVFEGLRVFLSREVPRLVLCLLVRSGGGLVSWDTMSGPGSLFSVEDSSITHEVVDRPLGEARRPGRAYVQPQWFFDCLNAGEILPTAAYAPGAPPPSHLSPFVADTQVPPAAAVPRPAPAVEEAAEKRKVRAGKVARAPEPGRAENEERKLREMMLPKKHKELYKKMVHSRKRQAKEALKLKSKRARIQQ